MEEVGRVEKNGYNTFHKYAYVKEDDLVEAVRGKLSERGILLLPSVEHCSREDNLTTVILKFTFIDSETTQTYTAQWAGTGDDKGDKGLYKAYTGAVKYFLMKTFLIPTGDDPEGDEKTDKRVEKKGTSANKPPTERDTLMAGVQDACKLLNSAGDVPPWTPGRLKEYVLSELSAASIDDLGVVEIGELLKRLSLRLEILKDGTMESEPSIPKCGCGIERVRREGMKNGKKWAAWMCANKVKEHSPIWIPVEEEEPPF